MRLSVLDLGSNSFHVLVADVDETGMVVPVAREREMLHLGAVVAEHGSIPDDVRADAVAVVAHFTALATRLGAEQRLAVATSALRDADNGPSVVAHMEIAADTAIRVIDGHEEGELAFAGVAASLGAATTPRLMLDLGGGSLELAVGTGHTIDHATTFPVGVSRLAGMLADDPPSKQDVRQLRQHVRDVLAPAIDRFPLDDVTQVVAVGGTVRALARVAAARAGRWLPATLNLLHLDRAQFTDLRKRLNRMDRDERLDEPGMKDKRADHVHVAATIVDTVLRELGIDEVVVSDWGLREGVLLQAREAVPPALPELREREVVRMQKTFLPDDPHLDHVGGLAGRLFDATTELHGLDASARELVVIGARLHGVGQSLALRRQHHHGAYLIEHMELRGFSPRETAMLCCMARFHSTRGMSSKFPAFAAMDDADRDTTRRMVALVQVADGLDRARDQAVDDVEVRRNRDVVGLRLRGDQLHVAVEEVQRRTAFFEQVFDVTVVVTVAPVGSTA